MSYFSRLRELPPDQRKRAVLKLSVLLTFIVVVGWILIPTKEEIREGVDLGPAFSEFGESVSEEWGKLWEGWSETVEGFKQIQSSATSTETASSTPIASTTPGASTTTSETTN